MLALTEEKLETVFGGEDELVNGWGGGSFIHVGDKVTWNGHKDWGTGVVDCILWGYAYVTFYPKHMEP
ncbi:MAG: hypothetical protein K6F90_01335, partial [Lachnospiraceae bacterium]|nr:hypothetical protein [Lachnospiraceae bacterium]